MVYVGIENLLSLSLSLSDSPSLSLYSFLINLFNVFPSRLSLSLCFSLSASPLPFYFIAQHRFDSAKILAQKKRMCAYVCVFRISTWE